MVVYGHLQGEHVTIVGGEMVILFERRRVEISLSKHERRGERVEKGVSVIVHSINKNLNCRLLDTGLVWFSSIKVENNAAALNVRVNREA